MRTYFFRRFLVAGIKPLHWVLLVVLGGAIALFPALSASLTLSWQAWLAIAVTVLAFLLNALTQIAPEAIFFGGLSLLLLTGVLNPESALAGFSNSGMVTVGVLYIVVTGLQQTGGLVWISQQVLGLPKGLPSALFRLVTPVMGMSAFLNNTPVVAMFVPVVDEWSRKLRLSPSKLMIPLSYAAIFGGICTLIGTSTNLVVNGLLISQAGMEGLQMFDITRVGLPCALAGFVYVLVVSPLLLPDRKPVLDLEGDPRQYTVEMVVEPKSPMIGKTIEQAGLRHLPGLFLGEIVRQGQVLPAVSPQVRLQANDQLVFVGVVDSIVDLRKLRGLQPATDQLFKLDGAKTDRCLIEAIVSNTCPMIGRSIREGGFRTRYNAVVLAVARNGDRLSGKLGDIRLLPGDALLLEAAPSFLNRQRVSRDFYLLSGVSDSEPLRHERAPLAIAILLAMVLLAAIGWMDMLNAAILAAMAMLISQCCSVERAFRSIEWSVLLVIAAALGIGEALESTGAASEIAALFIGWAGENPWLALAVVYGITTILTEVITNNAAAALVFPIALAVAKTLEVNFLPFAIAIMIAASASFATPIGYQTNLMVYGPGGYRFSDFMRVGIPLNLLFAVISIAITPLMFPF